MYRLCMYKLFFCHLILIFYGFLVKVNLSGLDLHPPVTFRLKHGSGPVYVGAEHVAREGRFSLVYLILRVSVMWVWLLKCFPVEEFSDDEEMDEEVEEEEEDIEESPVKKVTKNGAGKVRAGLTWTHKSHFWNLSLLLILTLLFSLLKRKKPEKAEDE